MANNAPQGRALKTYTKKESAMYYVGLAGQNVFYNVIGTALTYYLQFTFSLPFLSPRSQSASLWLSPACGTQSTTR